MYFKKMTGKKCFLSPINPDDAPKYTQWLNDLEVCEFLQLSSASIPLHREREILESMSKEHNYAIVDLETGLLLGNTGLMNVDHLHQTAEAGIFIGNKDFWGKGYGAEALSLLLDYAFKQLNLYSIMLRVYSFNTRAIRCYETVGFKKIGEWRKSLRRNREAFNIILMDILPEDFYGGV